MKNMETIAKIRAEYERDAHTEPDAFIEKYRDDERAGVQSLVKKAQRWIDFSESEQERLEKMRVFEHQYEERGLVCGIDEAGRGPLAGPVVAAAVILPKDCSIFYLNDSKKLTPRRREELYDEIQYRAVAIGVGIRGPQRIDEVNILQADYEAMREAISLLSERPAVLLNDAVTIPGVDIPQVPVIHGDAKSVSIAAASVIAKVTRDRMMPDFDRMYPGYGFAENKGYGTAEHIAALKKLGPCPIHRKTFITHFVDV